jgi:hypothetical protein
MAKKIEALLSGNASILFLQAGFCRSRLRDPALLDGRLGNGFSKHRLAALVSAYCCRSKTRPA